MKYRVRKEGDKFRAEVLKERCQHSAWLAIENDNTDLGYHKMLYDSVEDAIEACKKHHVEKGYDKKDNEGVVKEFEL